MFFVGAGPLVLLFAVFAALNEVARTTDASPHFEMQGPDLIERIFDFKSHEFWL